MTVIDLGAAPGGWSEYCVKKLGKKGIDRCTGYPAHGTYRRRHHHRRRLP